MGELLAIAAGLFFGASNVTVRQGQLQGELDLFLGLFIGLLVNNLVNLVVLTAVCLGRQSFPPLNFMAVLCFAAAGILTSFVGRILLFRSISYIGPSRVGALKIIAPVFTVLLGVLLLNERMSPPAFFGIGFILLGAYFVSYDMHSLQSQENTRKFSPNMRGKRQSQIGLVLTLLAGAAFGTGNVFRKLGIDYYQEPVMGVAISSFIALVAILGVFVKQHRLNEIVTSLPFMIKGGYLWTGIFMSLALYATFTALMFSPVSIVNSLKTTEPLFTMFLSVWFLRAREVITGKFVITSLVILTGVIIVYIFS